MEIKQVSTDTLLISFENTINLQTSLKVQKIVQYLKDYNNNGIIEIVPSYSTILVQYDIFAFSFSHLKELLFAHKNKKASETKSLEIVTIDVYYGLDVGLDLETISKKKQISVEEIIEIHSNKLYHVYAMGFLPGFGFLADVDEKIATPRQQTPRKKVLQGSVAIADKQTAVYPSDSAGGWNIIGKTTKKLFLKNNPLDSISPLAIGKKVKFNPITKKEFLAQGGLV